MSAEASRLSIPVSGPAAAAGFWRFGAVYAFAPAAAALLAAGLRRGGRRRHPAPHTGKLFHDPRYRSLFRDDRLPSRPPREVMRRAEGIHAEGGE